MWDVIFAQNVVREILEFHIIRLGVSVHGFLK